MIDTTPAAPLSPPRIRNSESTPPVIASLGQSPTVNTTRLTNSSKLIPLPNPSTPSPPSSIFPHLPHQPAPSTTTTNQTTATITTSHTTTKMHLPTTLLAAFATLALAEPCAFSRRVLTQCGDGPLFNIDPDTGAICDALDCGGGRAPPKTTVPGCPLYSGPLPSTTRFLECWTPTSSSVIVTTTSTGAGAGGSVGAGAGAGAGTTGVGASNTEGGMGVQTTLPPVGGTTGAPTKATATTTAVSTNGVEGGRVRGLVGVVAVLVGVVQVVMV